MLSHNDYREAARTWESALANCSWDGIPIRVLSFRYNSSSVMSVPFPAHQHSGYEFHLIPSGCGQLRVGDQAYEVGPHSIYVTGPGFIHEQRAHPSDPWAEFGWEIASDGIPLNAFSDLGQVFATFRSREASVPRNGNSCFATMDELTSEALTSKQGQQTRIQQLFIQLLIEVARAISPTTSGLPIQNPGFNRMDWIRRFVEDNYANEITTEDVSRLLYLSVRQADRTIRQHFGQSFHAYLEYYRVEQAKNRLRDSVNTIGQIAEETGFSSSHYFHRVFRKLTGSTPTDYRKQNDSLD